MRRHQDKHTMTASQFLLVEIIFMFAVTTKIWALPNSHCAFNRTNHFLNCSSRQLGFVPTKEFPADVKTINLSFNNVKQLNYGTFANVSGLLYLDLSYNEIVIVDPGTFANLTHLISLNLSANQFHLSVEILSPELFAPLESLRDLQIQCPWENFQWRGIDRAFAKLKNLTTLLVFLPFEFTFGFDFRGLSQLKSLSTSTRATNGQNWCNLWVVQTNTFKVFRQIPLRELRLVNCEIESISGKAFDPLKSLEVLDLSHNPKLTLQKGLASLRGLQGNSMTEISMVMLNGEFDGHEFYYRLGPEDFKYLSNICVNKLDISRNYISFVEDSRKQLKFRFDCLENLKMSNHTQDFLPVKFLSSLRFAYNLRYLDFSHQIRTSTFKNLDFPNSPTGNFTWHIPVSPNLTRLSLSGCIGWFERHGALDFTPISNLEHLEAANLWFDNCLLPFANGLPNITYLDISGIKCRDINKKYFQNIRKITTLNISNSPNLNNAFIRSRNPFGYLTALEEIDLSGIQFTNLEADLFQNNKHLRIVYLSNNKIQRLPRAVLEIEQLHLLDLSSNVFTHLLPDEMRRIDSWITGMRGVRSFRLRLRDNPFQCSCQTVTFIRWITQRTVYLDGTSSYNCLMDNGSWMSMQEFETQLTDFEVRCVSHTYLVISVVGTLVLLVLILLLTVIYRYRLNIRYWLHTRLQSQAADTIPVNEYIYDAFVAYTSENYEWVIHQLRPNLELVDEPINLCIHDRDFIPGKLIHDNIVDKMKESRKIMLIISTGFLISSYGPLEIEYAGMKCLEEGRDDIILCVLMEEIPARQMPRALRNLWHKITFLKWSADPQEQVIFWRNLKGALRRP